MKRSAFSLIRLGLLGVACVSLASQLLSGKAPQSQPIPVKPPTPDSAITGVPHRTQITDHKNRRVAFIATLFTVQSDSFTAR